MKRVNCVGMVGRYPTPKGSLMFWDTGKSITPVQLVEALALQHSISNATGRAKKEAIGKAYELIMEVVNQTNVYPIGQAALDGDGRILVTEPFYEEKEA